MKIKIFLILSFYLQVSPVFTQIKTIHGIVLDSLSKEPLIGVTIYDAINDRIYSTNIEGRFGLKVERKKQLDLFFQYTGYMPKVYKQNNPEDNLVIILNVLNFDGPVRIIPKPRYEKSKNGKEIYFYSGYKQFEPYERKVNKILQKKKA